MRQWQALRIQRRQQPGVRTRDAGNRELLPVGSPGEKFLLCVLQHSRQGEIAVVAAQNWDHLRIRPGIRLVMASSAVCSRQCALVFSQKMIAVALST
jgi:hypothetical protein